MASEDATSGHRSPVDALPGDNAVISLDSHSLREIFAAESGPLARVMLRLADDLDKPSGISSAFSSFAAAGP